MQQLRKRRVLLLPPALGNIPTPLLINEFAKPIPRLIEHAGHAYHTRVVKLLQEAEDFSAVENSVHNSTSSADEGVFVCEVQAVQFASHDDYYAMLGIAHLARIATHDQIRKAYRKVSLFYHPDKNALNDLEKSDRIFKSIQVAYDTLMDTRLREVYDSSIPFDDSIPSPNIDADFFVLYRSVFQRNAVFSQIQPVPDLGNESTPFAEVDKFYDFWFGFKSWREFPQEEQYNLEDAESRDERRWMEKQNARVQAAAKKEEAARIRKLVEQAFNKDPRVQREKEERKLLEKQEKLARKQAKDDIKRKKMEEEQKKMEEEKRIEEERIAAENALKEESRKKKEEVKRLQKKIRRKFSSNISEELIKSFINSIAIEDLESVYQKVEQDQFSESEIIEYIKKFEEEEAKRQNSMKDEKRSSDVPSSSSQNNEAQESDAIADWTEEELKLLSKAIARYPGGTQERWEKVSAFVKTKSIDQVMQKVKELKKSTRKPGEASVVPSTPQKSSAAAETVENPEEWTSEQQSLFESALRTVPKDHPDRWGEIANLVKGKSKKDCIKRFKEIRAMLASGK